MANPNQGPGAPAKTPGASGPAEPGKGDEKRIPLQARWTMPPSPAAGEPDRDRAAESASAASQPPSPPESGLSEPSPTSPQEPQQPPSCDAADIVLPPVPDLVAELNRLAASLQEVARALADLDTALHRGPSTPDSDTSNPALLSQLFQGRHDIEDALRRYLFGKPG